MPKKIPQSFLDDLIGRTDIVDIIQARIKIQKKGQNYSGLCPFHDEKSPSFSVNPAKQFYYCFGCGAHGNAISFLMAFDRMTFVDAVDDLAARLGLEVATEASGNNQTNFKEDYQLLQTVSLYFQKQLRCAERAVQYLKSRGLSGAIAKQFAIGFAPPSWDTIAKLAMTIGIEQKELITHGLCIQKDKGGCYDRFRDRIIFPIRDYRGRVIAFGGRTIGDDSAKYINSPETPLFHKSDHLYGLYETLQHNHNPEKILIVEGYMDVIALHQHGVPYAVASLGTATNTQQVQKLFRYSKQVVFCFDGDSAGRKAAWKALTHNLGIMRDGVQLRFMFLSHGDDPDSLIRRVGTEGFLQRLNNAEPISNVFFELIKQEIPLDCAENKARFAKESANYLNKVPKGIFRDLMFEKLAKQLNLYQSDISQLESSTLTQHHSKVTNKLLTNTQRAIALLLQEPKLCHQKNLISALEHCNDERYSLLHRLIKLLSQNPEHSIGEIIEHCESDAEKAEIARLAAHKLPFPPEATLTEFEGVVLRLQEQQVDRITQALIEKARNKQITDEERKKLAEILTLKHRDDKRL